MEKKQFTIIIKEGLLKNAILKDASKKGFNSCPQQVVRTILCKHYKLKIE